MRFETHQGRWTLVLSPRHAPLSRALSRITLAGRNEVLEDMEVLDAEGARTVTRLEKVRSDRPFAADELAILFEEGRPLPSPSGP